MRFELRVRNGSRGEQRWEGRKRKINRSSHDRSEHWGIAHANIHWRASEGTLLAAKSGPRLNYAIIRWNGQGDAGVEHTLAKRCAVAIARCIDRRDFGGDGRGWSILAIRWGEKRERERESEKKGLKVPRVKKKSPPSVKYCPENRTVFINPARKSVFM